MRFDKRVAATLVVLFVSFGSSGQISEKKHLVYRQKYIMGTVFEIAAYGESSEQTLNAIDKAFQEIVRVDDVMSNYKPESELSTLNRSAQYHRVKVPQDLYRVIEQAIQFSKMSEGKFDITVAPLVNLWKSALSGDALPSPAQLHEAQTCIGYEKIELTPPDYIMFHSRCMQLDLGAIGKGYAVDRAGEVLASVQIQDAFINAGGSTILAMGSPPGQAAWLVHLRDPSHTVDPYIMLKDESISTSEQTAPSLLGSESAGHIIDPSIGRPLETHFAVTVVAPSGMMSDGFSTTLLLLGPTQGKALVNHTSNVSAIWLSPKAQVETAMNGPKILFGGKL